MLLLALGHRRQSRQGDGNPTIGLGGTGRQTQGEDKGKAHGKDLLKRDQTAE
ncbi:hypothetical protein MASR1M49_07020 [Pararhodobacter aggregans]